MYYIGVIMFSIRLPKDIENRINKLSEVTKRPKSFFVKEALNSYLSDLEEYYTALERKNDKNRELISIDELKRALEL